MYDYGDNTPFNRTSMESKPARISRPFIGTGSFNRTSMESKQAPSTRHQKTLNRF